MSGVFGMRRVGDFLAACIEKQQERLKNLGPQPLGYKYLS